MLGVLALLAVGGIQIEQYTVARYSVIPTIGELFLANFIAASACGRADSTADLAVLLTTPGQARRHPF